MLPILLIVAGALTLAGGIALVYLPAGVIALGVLALVGGITWDLATPDDEHGAAE